MCLYEKYNCMVTGIRMKCNLCIFVLTQYTKFMVSLKIIKTPSESSVFLTDIHVTMVSGQRNINLC